MFKDRLTRLLFFAGLIVIVGTIAYDYYLTGIFVSYPRAPQTATGQIVPHRVRSVTVYVTRHEMNTLNVLQTLEIIGLGVVVIAIGLRIIGGRLSR
jgi:hypothetical protein